MLTGSMVALVTPMKQDGALDKDRLGELVEFHIQEGTDAIVAVGTTGESATLDAEEHCQVIAWIKDMVAGRIPVIAGTGSNSTQEAIELSSRAKSLGVDALLLVTPYYNKPTQEGLYRHYEKIAREVSMPQILYNVPGRTACDMSADTVTRLAKIANIVGIKEATGDISRAEQILQQCSDDFAVYSGDDATAMDLMLAGGHGVISVTANVAPKKMSQLCRSAMEKDRQQATQINEVLMPLHQNLFLEANPIPVKWALYRMGKIDNGIRLPLTVLSEEHHKQISEDLRNLALITD